MSSSKQGNCSKAASLSSATDTPLPSRFQEAAWEKQAATGPRAAAELSAALASQVRQELEAGLTSKMHSKIQRELQRHALHGRPGLTIFALVLLVVFGSLTTVIAVFVYRFRLDVRATLRNLRSTLVFKDVRA